MGRARKKARKQILSQRSGLPLKRWSAFGKAPLSMACEDIERAELEPKTLRKRKKKSIQNLRGRRKRCRRFARKTKKTADKTRHKNGERGDLDSHKS